VQIASAKVQGVFEEMEEGQRPDRVMELAELQEQGS
jgi:hypothetical protein